MEQLERIRHMESILDEGMAAAAELEAALERFQAAAPAMEELFAYCFGPLWRQDLADDEAGRLPAELKRGVLSEDAAYDLFTDWRRLEKTMRNISGT